MNKDKIDLNIGNEVRIVVLTLLNGLILKLDNCYFVIALSRNIVPIFNGFRFIIKGKYYSFYNNDIYYRYDNINGLYIPDFEMSKFNITSKKNKLDNQ